MIFTTEPLSVTKCLNRKIVKFQENLSNVSFVQKGLRGKIIVKFMFVHTLEKNLTNASFVQKGLRSKQAAKHMSELIQEKNPSNATFVKRSS